MNRKNTRLDCRTAKEQSAARIVRHSTPAHYHRINMLATNLQKCGEMLASSRKTIARNFVSASASLGYGERDLAPM